jgi:hypothetical protein
VRTNHRCCCLEGSTREGGREEAKNVPGDSSDSHGCEYEYDRRLECDVWCARIDSAASTDQQSFNPAVINLWSVTPTQGVGDCLGYDINHFLVASVSQQTTYTF